MKLKQIHSLMFAAGLGIATLASAQAPAPAPAPAAAGVPPTWAQGRTADGMNPALVPNPSPLVAKPVNEILIDKLKVPPGFKIELWASGMPNARSMTESPSGTIFVGTRFPGNVYAVVSKDGKREVKTIAKGLHRPNGVAFVNGSLYVAELSRIIRYDNIEQNLDNPPAPVVVFDALRAMFSAGISRTPTSEAKTTRPSFVTQNREGRSPLRSSTAPTWWPSVKVTQAGPSHGSISDAWKA